MQLREVCRCEPSEARTCNDCVARIAGQATNLAHTRQQLIDDEGGEFSIGAKLYIAMLLVDGADENRDQWGHRAGRNEVVQYRCGRNRLEIRLPIEQQQEGITGPARSIGRRRIDRHLTGVAQGLAGNFNGFYGSLGHTHARRKPGFGWRCRPVEIGRAQRPPGVFVHVEQTTARIRKQLVRQPVERQPRNGLLIDLPALRPGQVIAIAGACIDDEGFLQYVGAGDSLEARQHATAAGNEAADQPCVGFFVGVRGPQYEGHPRLPG